MKTKILFFLLALLATLPVSAQSEIVDDEDVDEDEVYSATRRVYCELLGVEAGFLSRKVKIIVDFGQNRSLTSDERLVDENGKVIKFNSMIDGMNYMGQFGWIFTQAYVVTTGNQNVYHWLLYKDIDRDSQRYEGFMTKQQFKEAAKLLQADWVSCKLQYLRKTKKAYAWDVMKEEEVKLPKEEIQKLIDEWKAQESQSFDYDVKVTKQK